MRVYIYENTSNGDLLATNANAERPLAGIWWRTAHILVAVLDPIAQSDCGPRIDSDLTHADVWPLIARQFGLSPSCEYFEMARGRVQLNHHEGCGIVLGGRTTGVAQAKAIARVFGLVEWRIEHDDHYATGVDADALFDEP